jgi:hypothetical protein
MKKDVLYDCIIIEANEDGNFMSFLSKTELLEMLDDYEKEGIEVGFFEELPGELNPFYWPEDNLLILKIDGLVVPEIKLDYRRNL